MTTDLLGRCKGFWKALPVSLPISNIQQIFDFIFRAVCVIRGLYLTVFAEVDMVTTTPLYNVCTTDKRHQGRWPKQVP